MIEKTDISLGSGSINRLPETGDPSGNGAEAALESFYYSLNNRDIDALRANWSASPLAQLNNPVGAILRGGDAISELYSRIFSGTVNVEVTFGDVVPTSGIGMPCSPAGRSVPIPPPTVRRFRSRSARAGTSATRTAGGVSITTTEASTIPTPCVLISAPSGATEIQLPPPPGQAPGNSKIASGSMSWAPRRGR